MGRIFVSYSRKDTALVDQLYDQIGRVYQLWIDRRDLEAANRWDQQLQQAIENSEAVLLIVSANSNASTYVPKEVIYAQGHSKPVLPYIVDGAPLPFALGDVQAVTATEGLPKLLDQLASIAPLARIHSGLPIPNEWIGDNSKTFNWAAEEAKAKGAIRLSDSVMAGFPVDYTRYHAVYLFGRKNDSLAVPEKIQLAFQLTGNYYPTPRNDPFVGEIALRLRQQDANVTPYIFVVRGPLKAAFRQDRWDAVHEYGLGVTGEHYQDEWHDSTVAARRVFNPIGKPQMLQIFIQGPAVLLYQLGAETHNLIAHGVELYHYERDIPAVQKYYCIFSRP